MLLSIAKIKMVEGERAWVTYMKRQVFKKNNCINLIATSKPGGGKSYSLLSQFSLIDPDFDVNEQCFFKALSLIRLFESGNITKGKPIMFDEIGIDAHAQNWQDPINKGLNAFFQTARHRNYIFGCTVPYLSFVSKGVRTLMNTHFRVTGWKGTTTMVRPFILQYNGDLDKFYRRRLLIENLNGDVGYCDQIDLPKPSKKIVTEYEKIKTEFTTNLFKDIGDSIVKKLNKDNKMVILTKNQEEVLKELKEGKTVREIAKQRCVTSRNILLVIYSLRRKGIKVTQQSVFRGKVTYIVEDSVLVNGIAPPTRE